MGGGATKPLVEEDKVLFLEGAQKRKKKLVQSYIKRGIDLATKDEWGNTALHQAARNNDVEILNILLDAGIDINTKNAKGWTALYIATMHGQTEVQKSLIARGAEIINAPPVVPGSGKSLPPLKRQMTTTLSEM